MGSLPFALVSGLGAALYGQMAAAQLNRRTALLEAWLLTLKRFASLLPMRVESLSDLIEMAAREETCPVVQTALLQATDALSQDRFQTLTDVLSCPKELTPKDWAVIASGLAALGTGDHDTTAQQLASATMRLQEVRILALEKAQKNTRLFRSLGALGGLCVFLFLL